MFWWLFPLKRGVISTLLQEHIFSKDNYQTKENRGIWVYSVFPCVAFSGLNTKGVTFCCSSMSLGRPGTFPCVSTEFKICCVHVKSSAAAGGFGSHCHSPDIHRQVKRKKQRENCVPNKSVVPQEPHCNNKNTADLHYMFKSISLTSYLNKHKQKKQTSYLNQNESVWFLNWDVSQSSCTFL